MCLQGLLLQLLQPTQVHVNRLSYSKGKQKRNLFAEIHLLEFILK